MQRCGGEDDRVKERKKRMVHMRHFIAWRFLSPPGTKGEKIRSLKEREREMYTNTKPILLVVRIRLRTVLRRSLLSERSIKFREKKGIKKRRGNSSSRW